MATDNKISSFISAVEQALSDNTFVSISMGNYKGDEPGLKQLLVKQALIKQERKLSITFRYKTRDIVRNFVIPEGIDAIAQQLNSGFRVATLFTTSSDLIYEYFNEKKTTLRQAEATKKDAPDLSHDKAKQRLITAQNKSYLFELGITDKDGNVYKNAQDKYRQINHYIDLLNPLIKEIPEAHLLKVADMGSGKGYLTFALYDYLVNVLKLSPEVTGVEYRADMVKLCNEVAKKSNFGKLNFVEGTIQDFDSTGTNILIALHACDTATDDAIAKGIAAGSDLIVVAPCCHKQIRREIEKHKAHNDLSFLTRHGIFMEREAEMVTDSIRALILEYYGYKTKVFEFISDAHTPKNVMIAATKQDRPADKATILKKINDAKAYFGISYHHLERALGIN